MGSVLAAFMALRASADSGWQAEETLLSQLGAEVKIEDFYLRSPANSFFEEQKGPEGAKLFIWKRNEKTKTPSAYFVVMVAAISADEANAFTPQSALEIFLEAVESRHRDFNPAASESGKVNGIPFARVHWGGADILTGQKMQGFMYVTMDAEKIVQIAGRNPETQPNVPLKIAEASALSFHR